MTADPAAPAALDSAAPGPAAVRPLAPARSSRSAHALALLAIAVALACILFRLGALPLLQPDEGRNAEVAREMHATGAWLIPTYDGLPYLDKPAFYFRAVALSFALFGESEGAARLPSAIFALALLALLWAFCRREYDARTAALAVLVVGTTPLYIAFSRIVIFDMALALFVCGAVFAAYLAEERGGAWRARWYLAGAACAGVATLIKGPVGFIVPALVAIAFLRVDGRRGAGRRLLAPRNLLLWLAIVLPWFAGVTLLHRDFAYYGLVRESLDRYTTPAFHRTAPAWYYIPVIAAVFFPWSAFLPESLVAGWRARARLARADRLFATWAVVVVVFFSISQSKLPGYVLTAVIALGVLVARLLARALAAPASRAAAIVLRGALALGVVSAVLAAALGWELRAPGALGRLFHIRHGETAALIAALGPLLWALVAVIALVVLARRRRDVRLAAAAFVILPLSLPTLAFPGMARYAEARSARALAGRLDALPGNAELACLECFPNGLSFYLKRPIVVISHDGSEMTSNYIVFALSRARRWPDVVVPAPERDRWLAAVRQPVFLLARDDRRAALDSLAAAHGARVVRLTPGWQGALLVSDAERGN
ncbi:MAG TPA: glycosyltransferase family 39 protein [Gemmatimonadaceae bacterium]|nr:glycosyltransferase family 39 protein [Gemmatimonadaceae bacterium]